MKMEPAATGITQFQLLTGEDDLDRIAPVWKALLEASAQPELMQDFRWLRSWWRHYGGGRALAVGTFYDGETLVAIAPCCRRVFRYRLGIRFERLDLLGAGEGEADSVCSEYLGLIVREGYEERAAGAFAAEVIKGGFGPWDECVLEMMHGKSPIVEAIARWFGEHGLTPELSTTMEAPYVALPSNWASFERTLGKKRRQAVKYAIRDFAVWAGERGYTLRRASDGQSLQEGFRILLDLHEERWRGDGKAGAFASPRFRAFHEEVAPQFLATGQLDLSWVTVGDEPVAAHYSFTADGRNYFYQSGRKMDVPKAIRPGIVMMRLAVEDAMNRGMREFDLLGGKSQYKMLFARATRPLVRLRVARPRLREYLRRTLARCRELARKRIGPRARNAAGDHQARVLLAAARRQTSSSFPASISQS